MLGSVYFSVRKHAGLRFYNSCRKRFYRSMYFAVELQMYTRASFFDCTTYCRALSNTSWDMYYFEHLHFILKIINDTIYLQYLIVKILSWLQNCIKIIDEIKKPWYNISIEEYIYRKGLADMKRRRNINMYIYSRHRYRFGFFGYSYAGICWGAFDFKFFEIGLTFFRS